MNTSSLASCLARLPAALAVVVGSLILPAAASAQQGYQVQGPPPAGYGTGGAPQRQSLFQAPAYSPYAQQGYQQAPKSAPKPKAVYNNNPYGQQPYGQQPYSYPASKPQQPKGQPQIPPYQYAPKPGGSRPVSQTNRPVSHTSGSSSLANEVAEIKAHQRRLDQRVDALESRSTVGGGYVSSTPSGQSYVTHKVQYGDSLLGLASRYGTTSSQIKSTNHLSSNLLSEGQVLKIPAKSGSKGKSYSSDAPRSKGNGTHIVQRGESLSTIASRYGLSSSTLQKANGIRNPDLLVVGQKLTLPGRSGKSDYGPETSRKGTIASKTSSKGPAGPSYVSKSNRYSKPPPTYNPDSPPPAGAGTIAPSKGNRGITSYRVESGDSIESVARLFGTTASEIQRKNKLPSAKLPAVGEEIVVPQPGSVSS